MRAGRNTFAVIFELMTIAILVACSLTGTALAPSAQVPTPTLESLNPPASGTTTESPVGSTATAEPVVPGTQTPVSATPVLGTAIPHLAAGQAIHITVVHMVDADQGWAIGGLAQAGDHILRTQTGGQTWQDVTPPQPAPPAGEPMEALGYFTDASNGWVSYGPPADSGSIPPYILVWFTHDGGASWNYGTIDTSGVSSETFSPWYLDFPDSRHGWLLVLLGGGMNHAYVALYSTSDGGATWTDILDPYIGGDIQSFPKTGMVFVDAHTGWLTRDGQGVDPAPHIFITQDGGVTWTRIDLPVPDGTTGWFDNNSCGTYSPEALSTRSALLVMKCLDNATYKVEHDYLYSTSDSGQTWQSFPLPSDFTVADPPAGGLYFTDSQTGLALGRRIYRTENGGKTWSTAKLVNWDGQFSFLNLNTGWAVARNEGQIALVMTVDGGRTWQEIRPVLSP